LLHLAIVISRLAAMKKAAQAGGPFLKSLF
jgi:hypothetical protein